MLAGDVTGCDGHAEGQPHSREVPVQLRPRTLVHMVRSRRMQALARRHQLTGTMPQPYSGSTTLRVRTRRTRAFYPPGVILRARRNGSKLFGDGA